MRTHVERSENRFEIKYLLSHREVPEVIESLEPYVEADRNWDDERGYPVYSVYWDSDAWTFFWEKIEGIKYRRKLRIRLYSGADYGFVEIKQRLDRTLQKRRARLPLQELHALFRGTAAGTYQPGEDPPPFPIRAPDDPVVSEALYLRHLYRLRPRMAVGYRRQAFYGRFEPDLRVTFDRRVQYDPWKLDLAEPFESGPYVVDPRLVIMEVKFSERTPLWMCKLVRRHGLRMVRLSKYCTAVDRAFFENRLT